MSHADWTAEVRKFEKPTHRMLLQEAEDACEPISSIGGAPWWPKGTERPKCKSNHFMSFVSQLSLRDLPDAPKDISGLCSFHYCIECQYEGNMAFGWNYEGNRNYDIRIFQNLEAETDELGIMSEPTVPPRTVGLERIMEIPDINDLPLGVSRAVPDEFFEFESPEPHSFIPSDIVWHNLKHVHGSKIGGHPTWVQDPAWPASPDGSRMTFLAQLDGLIGEAASWPGGTVFLFFHKDTDGDYSAEMGLQDS